MSMPIFKDRTSPWYHSRSGEARTLAGAPFASMGRIVLQSLLVGVLLCFIMCKAGDALENPPQDVQIRDTETHDIQFHALQPLDMDAPETKPPPPTMLGASFLHSPQPLALSQLAMPQKVGERAMEAKFSAPQDIMTPQQALIDSLRAMPIEDKISTLDALVSAADNGQPMAQWRLGRMYALGDVVGRDEMKAFDYFSRVVEAYDEDSTDGVDLALVSSAFNAIGVYCLNGIASADTKSDVPRAIALFKYAASNFGNADAQYNLARIYLDGLGGARDYVQAARWLRLASNKNHIVAQAVLGHLLFYGHEGVARQRARGLMLLQLAKAQAMQPKDQWIVDLCNKLEGEASEADKQLAQRYLEERGKHVN